MNIFAFGLDVFGTRVTPSGAFDVLGKSFNKLQMLATVAALFVAVALVGPLVSGTVIFRVNNKLINVLRSSENKSTCDGHCKDYDDACIDYDRYLYT